MSNINFKTNVVFVFTVWKCSLLVLMSGLFLHLPFLSVKLTIWIPHSHCMLHMIFVILFHGENISPTFVFHFRILLKWKENCHRYSLLDFFNLNRSDYQCHLEVKIGTLLYLILCNSWIHLQMKLFIFVFHFSYCLHHWDQGT